MPIKDKVCRDGLADLEAKSKTPTPEGKAKMSAVIVQLADPLLRRHGKTVEGPEATIVLTIAGWNKSMFLTHKHPVIEKTFSIVGFQRR